MTRVDGVHQSIKGARKRAGERVFVVQGHPVDPAGTVAQVHHTQEAAQAPVER